MALHHLLNKNIRFAIFLGALLIIALLIFALLSSHWKPEGGTKQLKMADSVECVIRLDSLWGDDLDIFTLEYRNTIDVINKDSRYAITFKKYKDSLLIRSLLIDIIEDCNTLERNHKFLKNNGKWIEKKFYVNDGETITVEWILSDTFLLEMVYKQYSLNPSYLEYCYIMSPHRFLRYEFQPNSMYFTFDDSKNMHQEVKFMKKQFGSSNETYWAQIDRLNDTMTIITECHGANDANPSWEIDTLCNPPIALFYFETFIGYKQFWKK